jgi:HSP20 family protein
MEPDKLRGIPFKNVSLFTLYRCSELSFWEEWEKRRKRGSPFIFRDIERMIEEMEKEMADVFKELEGQIPEDLAQEHILPDGSVKKEYGPFVYGYSVKIGPDGKPVVREFGNMKPNANVGEDKKPLSLQEAREPLVDIIQEQDQIKVIAELPGVEKEDIQLYATEKTLTIDVTNPEHRYHKELELPFEVDEDSAASTYRNGVLETVIKRKLEKGSGRTIKIQ